MTPEQERSRGIQAKRILEDDIYREAWQKYETVLINELAKVETKPERVLLLQAKLVGARKARQQLEQLMLSGQMAEEEEQRKRTIADRYADAILRAKG